MRPGQEEGSCRGREGGGEAGGLGAGESRGTRAGPGGRELRVRKHGVSFRALGLYSMSPPPHWGFATVFPGASHLSVHLSVCPSIHPSIHPLFVKYVLRASSAVV